MSIVSNEKNTANSANLSLIMDRYFSWQYQNVKIKLLLSKYLFETNRRKSNFHE